MNEPNSEQQRQDDALDPQLLWRLFIAFLAIGALTIVSIIFIPRTGLSVPWYVFAIAFLAIVAAALAPLFEGHPGVEDEESTPPQG